MAPNDLDERLITLEVKVDSALEHLEKLSQLVPVCAARGPMLDGLVKARLDQRLISIEQNQTFIKRLTAGLATAFGAMIAQHYDLFESLFRIFR